MRNKHVFRETAKNFGSMVIEDFSSKTEIMLWSENHAKYKHYAEKGNNVLISGYFGTRYNGEDFEFKITSISLLETAKQNLTRQLEIAFEPSVLNNEFVNFIEHNVKSNPGNTSLKFKIKEPLENLEIFLTSIDKGFTMNDEMAVFLMDNPDVEVCVGLAG